MSPREKARSRRLDERPEPGVMLGPDLHSPSVREFSVRRLWVVRGSKSKSNQLQ